MPDAADSRRDLSNGPMIIPHAQLSAQALQGLVEEFVTRDGTDYGEREASLDERVDHVMRQLDAGEALILFDPFAGSVTIVRRDQLPPGTSTEFSSEF